jgi:ribosomal protein S18 acetylase RimI-like enzyme
MQIRALHPEEWPLYREIRLRALAGAPDAFGMTYDAAVAISDDQWAAQFRERAATTIVLAACAEDGSLCATVQVYILPHEPGIAHAAGMWVEPEHRRGGVAAALLDASLADARRRGARRMQLHVTEGNDGAQRIYERAGFVFTGRWVPLREGNPLRALEMEAPLN